ncbi:MAG: DUF4240 domain-containing protein [Saprospiraceae bacterium]|nr:DUF4240 domain-containing protein [Saprospiraceae bacterium]MBP7641868.1 DUF4240 domain-containing protein [Saprospiraceae bacterium]HMS68063.1 DUF4240 domain-containing protein [Saprospiraceae bacterium]
MNFLEKLFGKINKRSNSGAQQIPNFNFTDKLMDEDEFWDIIKTTKEHSKGDYELQQEILESELSKLTPNEVLLFSNRFRSLRGLANTWELWGAIYIIQGGCGDDSFNDFREWVIGQGKDFYYKTIEDPESLANLDPEFIEETADFEGLGYIPSKVFKDLTGIEIQHTFKENQITTGKEWEEEGDDLKNMFPKIYAKYPTNI